MTNRFLKYLSFSLIFLLYFLFLFHKIDLSTADLGRHIMNGKTILETKQIPTTNFYSYTEPNFPTLNHHWLSGVIFYLIYSLAGFSGLSIFFILISLTTLFFFLKLREDSFTIIDSAERKSAEAKSDNQMSVDNTTVFREGGHTSSWPLIILVSLLALPLLAQRTEIRPEIFSYLFCGIYLYILPRIFSNSCHSDENRNLYNKKPRETKFAAAKFDSDLVTRLLLLLFLQILWVNLHIYFFLGIFLVAVFSLSNLISTRFKSWRFVLTLTSLTAPPMIRKIMDLKRSVGRGRIATHIPTQKVRSREEGIYHFYAGVVNSYSFLQTRDTRYASKAAGYAPTPDESISLDFELKAIDQPDMELPAAPVPKGMMKKTAPTSYTEPTSLTPVPGATPGIPKPITKPAPLSLEVPGIKPATGVVQVTRPLAPSAGVPPAMAKPSFPAPGAPPSIKTLPKPAAGLPKPSVAAPKPAALGGMQDQVKPENLYQELVLLEQKRYKAERSMRDLDAKHARGTITDAEYNDYQAKINESLNKLKENIAQLRRKMLSF